MIQANSVKELQEKKAELAVEKISQMMRGHEYSIGVLPSYAVILEKVSDLEWVPFLILSKIDNFYRICKAVPYVNKATRLQISIWMQDFDNVDDAEDFFLRILEADGLMDFGDLFRLSSGSGLRHIETIEEPISYIRVASRQQMS